jgi:hypothetical protein
MEKPAAAPSVLENRRNLETVLGTFIHRVNNATATILGKAQLAKLALLKGKIADPEGKLKPALDSIEQSVSKIGEALQLLSLLTDKNNEK